MVLKELRRKVEDASEKELIREAIRARKFSGTDTLRQGMNLIDFALKVSGKDNQEYWRSERSKGFKEKI